MIRDCPTCDQHPQRQDSFFDPPVRYMECPRCSREKWSGTTATPEQQARYDRETRIFLMGFSGIMSGVIILTAFVKWMITGSV